jgi:hypothetical protein
MFDFKELKSDRSLILAIRKKDQESFSLFFIIVIVPFCLPFPFASAIREKIRKTLFRTRSWLLWHNPEQVDPDKNIRSFLCSCVSEPHRKPP